jgi:hypothetical protein
MAGEETSNNNTEYFMRYYNNDATSSPLIKHQFNPRKRQAIAYARSRFPIQTKISKL